jgi:hypothetical protein
MGRGIAAVLDAEGVSVFTRQDVEQELVEIERFLQAIQPHLAVGEG